MTAERSDNSARGLSLSANAIWNLAGFGSSFVAALLLSPFIIHRLGDARYGVWVLAAEIAGYSAVFDFGIRGAVDHYVARYSSTGDRERLGRSLGAASWMLTALGGLLLLAGILMAVLFPHVFNARGVSPAEIRISVILMTVAVGVGLPMDLYISILYGRRRLDLSNAAELVPRVIVSFATWGALAAGGSLVAMGVVHLVGRAVSWVLRVWFVSRLRIGVPIRWRNADRHSCMELFGYGWKALMVYVSWLIIGRVDVVVIGAALGSAFVTFYAIGGSVVQYAFAPIGSIVLSLTPHLTHLHAKQDAAELRRVYMEASRVTALLSAVIAAGILVFGTPFLSLWLGPKYVTGPWTMRSDAVMKILLIANLPRILQGVSWQLMFAMRRVGFLMWVSAAEAAANLALSLILVRTLSLAGVAIGTLIPMLIFSGLIVPAYVLKVLQVGWGEYLKRSIGVPLLVGTSLCLCFQGLVFLRNPDSWPVLLMEGTAAGSIGLALLYVAIGPSRVKALLPRGIGTVNA